MGANTEQLQAINSNSERILCLAGAGAGKSTTLLSRISRLVDDGVNPNSILALTFTNAAGAEMRERYERSHAGQLAPQFRTFHSFCYYIVCRDPAIRSGLGYDTIPNIASVAEEKEVIEKAKAQCRISVPAAKLLSREGLTKKEKFQVELFDKAICRLLRQNNLITFDKLNSEVADLFAADHPATRKYKNQYEHIFVDECLPSNMTVLTNNGWYSIDRLYRDFIDNKALPLVKSYNLTTSKYEYKPIIGALKSENREIFEIHTEGLNKIRCTSNHKIYTQRGYVEAKDLVIGQDMIMLDRPDKQKTKYLLNDDQYQICLGSYLGDGHADKMSKFFTYRLNITHGIAQRDYFLSKISAFSLNYRIIKSGYADKLTILSSNHSKVFALKDDIFNCVVLDISPLGLAIWYQDDGSLDYGKYVRICTGSFSEEQNNLLVNMLKTRFGIEAKSHIDNKGYGYITFGARASKEFLDLVSPYMHPSMQYKTPIDISNNTISYNSKYLNIGANFIDNITYIGVDTVYDLTIADNHNFITSIHAHRADDKTGIIVHNCQDTDSHQMKFLQSFTNTNFFFVGDTLQNIYAFRGTSNEYIKALSNSPDWEKIKLFTNYRSTKQICEYANKFSASYADDSYRIEMQSERDGEKVITTSVASPSNYNVINTDGLDEVINELSKLSGTSAILARTNKEVSEINSYLKEKGIEFSTNHNTQIFNIINAAISEEYMIGWLASFLSSNKYGEYIRLCAQRKPDINWFLKTYGNNAKISKVASKISNLKKIATDPTSTAIKIEEIRKAFKLSDITPPDTELFGTELLQYIKDRLNDIKSSELYVGTIHSVKGLEYDNVFVMNVNSYSFKIKNDEEMSNLFYVACTRAKNRLFIYKIVNSEII